MKVVLGCQEGVYCDCCGGIFLEKFMSVLKYVTDFNSYDTYLRVYTNFFAATKMSGKINNNYGFLWVTQLKKMLANMSGIKFMAYFFHENTRQGNNANR